MTNGIIMKELRALRAGFHTVVDTNFIDIL